ncbi:MAG TPA: CopD family protein [Steroidobacteraceae bacterium]|nr:CopD family protein [Steroidobacteraceae bacterium]
MSAVDSLATVDSFTALDSLSAVLRAAAYLLQLQAAGTAMFLMLFGNGVHASLIVLRRDGRRVAAAAAAIIVCQFALEAGRMSGDWTGVFDPALQSLSLHSTSALAGGMRLAGLGLLAVGFLRQSRPALWLGVVLLVSAFPVTGHTSVSPQRLALIGLLALHVAIVSFWIGALSALLRVTQLEAVAIAARCIERFSAIAVAAVPLILLAGIGLTALLLQEPAQLLQPYGALLLAKGTLFGVLMGMAALNRWRFAPGIASGAATAMRSFRRTVVAEWLLIATVLLLTAILTTFYSPEAA